VQIYDGLDYRHWDTWNEGKFNHVFYKENEKEQELISGGRLLTPKKPSVVTKITSGLRTKRILYVSKKNRNNMPFRQTPIFTNIA
jgi:hypothetical protein